ncbi:MAG TPA: hypothetical protein VLA82_00140 [Actinomycetota bacterium]|nr:hypothetical protein [Actinomycetota bacterium]
MDDRALFVAMPERHLRSAAASGVADVVLPLGRSGDLARTPSGCAVYLVTLDDDGIAGPAATWRATLVGWTERDADADLDDVRGLPPSWRNERASRATAAAGPDVEPTASTVREPSTDTADDEADDDDDEGDAPRQLLMTVDGLTPLDRRDWIFCNEVVPKQRRGARSFVPMTPTLVDLPD